MKNRRLLMAFVSLFLFLIGEIVGLKIIDNERMIEERRVQQLYQSQKDYNCFLPTFTATKNVAQKRNIELKMLSSEIEEKLETSAPLRLAQVKSENVIIIEDGREEKIRQMYSLKEARKSEITKEASEFELLTENSWNQITELLTLEQEISFGKLEHFIEEKIQDEVGKEACQKISRFCEKYQMEEHYKDILKMIYLHKDEHSEKAMNYKITISEELQEYTRKICREYRIEQNLKLVFAIMYRESRFEINAINPCYSAYGLMQIHIYNYPMFLEEFAIDDLLDPYQNVRAGVYLLSLFLHEYEDVNMAIMAYGLGQDGAKELWEQGIYETDYTKEIGVIMENLH